VDVAAPTLIQKEQALRLGLCRSEALVLRTYPLKDSDLIVVLYTRNYGKLSGVARGARRPRSHFMGRLDALSLNEVVFFAKEGSELVSIDGMELLQAFAPKTTDYRCLMQLSFTAELMVKTIPEREPNDSLFRLLLLVLPRLTQPATSELAQLYFEAWLLRLSGFFPEYRQCHSCGRELQAGSPAWLESDGRKFLCVQCHTAGSAMLSPAALGLLDGICRRHLSDLYSKFPEPETVCEVRQTLEALLERTFERSFHALRMIPPSP
jgi:DNA repair protein RecO (recombination protein O)